MLHDNFPWVHVMKGRSRHPASQGCVERSHGPFKKALLAHLKEKDSDDWVHHMHVVQCKVNNRPSRARGNISPCSMYYSKTNKSCFASILGRSYKCAKTEYGIWLAKVVLEKIKVMDPQRFFPKLKLSSLLTVEMTCLCHVHSKKRRTLERVRMPY